MAAGHAHGLYLDRARPVHRLPPEVKIVAMVAFTIAVVATPREEFWAFGAYAVLVAGVAVAARVRAGWLLSRALIELPFVLLGAGPAVPRPGRAGDLAGADPVGRRPVRRRGTSSPRAPSACSRRCCWRRPPYATRSLGLDRLRCPPVLTQIATFMLRYLDVLADEARRMRIARISRGYDPRFLWQVKGFAVGIGALFLRAFERGERVYLAMVSRGYTGRLPAAWRADGAATRPVERRRGRRGRGRRHRGRASVLR